SAQSAGEHLDRQALQFRRPARQAGAHPRDKRLRAIRDLGDAVLDGPFGRAQAAAPIAIPVPGARPSPILVVLPSDRLGDLGLQRLLHDLAHGELEQLGPGVTVGYALGQQLLELLACSLRCRYSRGHGDASSCRRSQPATLGLDTKQECIPASFSSKSRTSPSDYWLPVNDSWGRSRAMAPVEREIRRDIGSKQLWALEVFQHEIVGCLGPLRYRGHGSEVPRRDDFRAEWRAAALLSGKDLQR